MTQDVSRTAEKKECLNCGEEIAPILDPWGRQHGWHHVKATDNSDGKYIEMCDLAKLLDRGNDVIAEPLVTA